MESFDFKEFTKWWENHQKEKINLEKRMDEVSKKAKEVYWKTQVMIDDWKAANKED